MAAVETEAKVRKQINEEVDKWSIIFTLAGILLLLLTVGY